MNTQGLTGQIEFAEGRRSNLKIDLLKLKRERIEKVGYWSPESGINVTDATAFYENNATNITLIVMTREVNVVYFSPFTVNDFQINQQQNEEEKKRFAVAEVSCIGFMQTNA